MPAGLSNLSERLNGTRQAPKKQMPTRSRTPSIPEVASELLKHDNDNVHCREQVNDEVVPLTEDAAFARCYYIDGFVNGRSKRPWEARIKLLFPQNPTWRSQDSADPAQTGLPTDKYGDMSEDGYWHFAAWGCTTASRDRFAALETPNGPSPEQIPTLMRAQTSVPTPSATWPQDPHSAPTARQAPCKPAAPTPESRRNQQQKPKPKPRAFNQVKTFNLNLNHSENAPTGCGCEKCLHRAGLDYDSLSPLEVVTSDNEIATIERPAPIAIPDPQPPSRASTMPAPSLPASDDGEPHSEGSSPRKRNGLRNLLGGLRGAKRGVAVSLSKGAASADGLAAHMKRSDSGYESLASAAVH